MSNLNFTISLDILIFMEDRYLRYKHLNEYLKLKFGERTLKICVDGGFTCPNRDGTCGTGGCIFCSSDGSGEHLSHTSICQQILEYFNSYKAQRANKFIVYFQNFTNTYADLSVLKDKYNSALIDDRIVGLQIATRPDCINEDIAKLLSSYLPQYYVCVELGLQTSNDKTASFINRGYASDKFSEAVKILRKYNIDVVCHIMIGLPGENFNDLKNTIQFLNQHDIQGIKIHSTYVLKNTKLCELYSNNQYIPISLEDYLEKLTYVITHINPNIIIHRISGDAPKNLLVAPEWNSHKKLVLNGLDKILKDRNLYQGCFYKKAE